MQFDSDPDLLSCQPGPHPHHPAATALCVYPGAQCPQEETGKWRGRAWGGGGGGGGGVAGANPGKKSDTLTTKDHEQPQGFV